MLDEDDVEDDVEGECIFEVGTRGAGFSEKGDAKGELRREEDVKS